MAVYFLRPRGADGPVKIGHSDNPERRLAVVNPWSPVELEIVATIKGGSELERRFHAAFFDLHTHGEWFAPSAQLTATIDAIRAGSFDVATLPEPRLLAPAYKWSPEWSEDVRATARVKAIARTGGTIPDDVLRVIGRTSRSPAARAERRELLRAFLDTAGAA